MTTGEIEKEITDIVSALKKQGKMYLAKCIEENWHKTAIAYSKELNSWEPTKPMEKELLAAFDKELSRLETEKGLKLKILNSLQKTRTLQTSPHLVATQGPRMLSINWLGSLGVKPDDFYVVGMFSGIPFSNNFRPGRINMKDGSVNLFPSSMQDGLVYRSTIDKKLLEARKDIPQKINALLPEGIVGESYTKWALDACQNIERKILEKENMIFLDINEVVTEYLLQVLKNKDHVLHKIFFDSATRAEFEKAFPEETIFYFPVMNGKYEKTENLVLTGKSLESKSKTIQLDEPETLIAELETGRLCPALVTSFLSVAFLNQFKCFGSFAQVEYLPMYQKKLAELKFLKEFEIEKVPTSNLTTGALGDLSPADIITSNDIHKFRNKEKIKWGELLLPIKDKLIEGRKNGSGKKIKENKKVHLIGIGGSGMSALAVLFKESGAEVTGTDASASEEFEAHLKKNNIPFEATYDEKNIPKDVDLVIVGNNAPFSAEVNPETKHAMDSSCKIMSMPEALAELSKDKENIIVVGSSGKSSTTGLLAWSLTQAKKDPSYFIGALPIDLPNSSHLGEGSEFVIEGDEYTSSKTDNRSKFLHFDPKAVILVSAAHDHINVFPTLESYLKPYKELAAKIPKDGLFVYALNGKNNEEIAKHVKCRKVSYSLSDESADYYAKNIKHDMESSFDLMHRQEGNENKVTTIKTKLLGNHNLENIIGTGALLFEDKRVEPEAFAEAINSFHGIKNRIELLNKDSALPVYQAFGSSYEKTKVFFDTLQLHFPKHRIVTVFEPHAFSWRNRKFLGWYKDIFDEVDEVIMLPAASYGKLAEDQLTAEEVWEEAKKYKNIHIAKNEKEGLQLIEKIVKEGDIVALVSSGLLLGLDKSIPKLLEKKFPTQ